jgi:predicted nucleic acid-binding Zn ribbon protein
MKAGKKKAGPKMSMMAWLATEGGRKCPACGKYAKAEQLGYTGFKTAGMIVNSYGHLPGYGCNRALTPRRP